VIDVRLPQLADGMISGKVAVWLKAEGEAVAEGEPIAELETDKASVELPAPSSGILHKINVAAGTEGVAVGALLAQISSELESSLKPDKPPMVERPESAAVSAEILQSIAAGRSSLHVKAAGADPRFNATPLARRMAEVAKIDLEEIDGAADGRRIVKADIEREISRRRVGSAPEMTSRPVSAGASIGDLAIASMSAAFEDKALTGMRRVTAGRLQQSKQTIPHFYLLVDCVADALMDMRSRLNANGTILQLTVTDFVVRAAALALRRVPEANSSWIDSAVRVYNRADISVAVNTPQGLVTPVVREADRKDLATISRELKALSERARLGRLQPAEYAGGTFTVSNLGMYGVTSLYPIINPPQSCILGIGAAEQRAIVSDGQLAVGRVISCTLAADHRALDGATGARFLGEFRRYIEDPLLMVFEA
jgi:pyruvate dehydrogenase E2 component (dihydrolipoamide acetyltransferase)